MLRGHLHTAWFKTTMLHRFYTICNCCKCCCLGMKFMKEHQIPMLISSGYRAVIKEGCIGCGLCVGYCQFEALEMRTTAGRGDGAKRCHVLDEKCYGCGVCTK